MIRIKQIFKSAGTFFRTKPWFVFVVVSPLIFAGGTYAGYNIYHSKIHKLISPNTIQEDQSDVSDNQESATIQNAGDAANITQETTKKSPNKTVGSTTNNNNASTNAASAPVSTPTPTTPIPDPIMTGINIVVTDSIYIPRCDYSTFGGSPPPCNHYQPVPINLVEKYSDSSTKPLSWNSANVSVMGNPNPVPGLLNINATNNLLELGDSAKYYLPSSLGSHVTISIKTQYQQWSFTKYITIFIVE